MTLVMEYIPIELWQYIHDMLDLKSQIYLKSTNKFFRYNVLIRDLLNIDLKFKHKLNQTIISNIANNNDVIKIDISYIKIIKNKLIDLSCLKNLQVLHANCFDGIVQDTIKNLNLVEFCCVDNNKIINVSFMTNLKILNISYDCDIDQNGIKNLDLVELNCKYNSKIIDVSFMTNLKILDISGNCGIDQNGIRNLDLVELNCDDNNKIIDVSFMTNLKILNIHNNCGVDQNGINGLNLLKLDARNNTKIYDVSFMTNLKILNISHDCGVNQDGIKGINPEELIIDYNNKISNVSHMNKLIRLEACGIKHVNFIKGIKNINPIFLDISDIKQINISDIYHMTKLRTLYLPFSTNIKKDEIEELGFKLINSFGHMLYSRNI